MFSGDHGRLKVIPQSSFRAVPKLTTRLFFGVRPATESVLSSESLKSTPRGVRGVICHSDTLQFTHHKTAPRAYQPPRYSGVLIWRHQRVPVDSSMPLLICPSADSAAGWPIEASTLQMVPDNRPGGHDRNNAIKSSNRDIRYIDQEHRVLNRCAQVRSGGFERDAVLNKTFVGRSANC